MMAKRLCVMVDHRVLMQFLESTSIVGKRNAAVGLGGDAFPESEQESSRLLVMLASLGEFKVLTTAAQIERLCTQLLAVGLRESQIARVVARLEQAVEPLPVGPVDVRKALADASGLPLDVKVTAAVARGVGAHVLVSPCALAGKSSVLAAPAIVSPVGFFHEVKRRYGFDYAALA